MNGFTNMVKAPAAAAGLLPNWFDTHMLAANALGLVNRWQTDFNGDVPLTYLMSGGSSITPSLTEPGGVLRLSCEAGCYVGIQNGYLLIPGSKPAPLVMNVETENWYTALRMRLETLSGNIDIRAGLWEVGIATHFAGFRVSGAGPVELSNGFGSTFGVATTYSPAVDGFHDFVVRGVAGIITMLVDGVSVGTVAAVASAPLAFGLFMIQSAGTNERLAIDKALVAYQQAP